MVAARITQMQSFMALMQMVIMPMFFLSGALFPVAELPHVAGDPQPPRPAHLRRRPDAPRGLRAPGHLPGGPRTRSTPASPGGAGTCPALLEAAVIALLGLVMLAVAIWEFSRAE